MSIIYTCISDKTRLSLGVFKWHNCISGTCESNSDILSLCFQSNDGTGHGPFGSADKGTPFSTTNVKDGYAITGFYGQNGIHINAIGVYMKPLPLPPPPPFIQVRFHRINYSLGC